MDLPALAIGFTLVLGTILSAIRTFVLPRAARSVVTVIVFRWVKRLFDLAARGSYERRDRILALYVPVSLFVLAGTWLVLLAWGFATIFWVVGYGSWGDSVWLSGSSLLTLGSAPIDSTGHRILAFVEAAIGLAVVALLISFLPSLYSAFSRRETLVALLEVRAGVPPSAPQMLIRFERIGWTKNLSDEWARWEEWFVEIEESHTSYPMLSFLRSPTAERSWVVAAGCVLDAASLSRSVVDRPAEPMADLCIRAGYTSMRKLAGYFGIRFDPDPNPGDPIAVTRSEFDQVLDEMDAAGVPIRADRDAAWADYAGWRVNYEAAILGMAELVGAPVSPWVSDRSAPAAEHRRPEWKRYSTKRIGF